MLHSPTINLYYRGKGRLKFDREDSNGLPTGLRHLGNAPDFTMSPTETSEKHYSSMEGVKTVDLEETTERELGGSFTLEEFDVKNLELALLSRENQSFVRPMSASSIIGKLDFWGTNDRGPKFHVQLWRVKIKTTAKLGMISDAIGQIAFEFTVLNDTTNHPNEPYGIITPLGQS